MKDFLGNELNVGDEVAFTAPQYRFLCIGKILAFTPLCVRLEYVNTWNYGEPGRVKTYLSDPHFLIKVIK